MINDEQMVQLEEEVRVGSHARSAYDNYLYHFIEQQNDHAWKSFNELKVNDIAGLQTCKFLTEAINHLEESILQDIETGRLARIQLGEQ